MTIYLSEIGSLFFLATILSLALALFIWGRRHILGASSMVMLLLCVAIWMGGMAMQSASNDPAGILFWFKVRKTGWQFLSLSWLYFVLQYQGSFSGVSRRQKNLLGIVPALATAMIWTNDYHHLFWAKSLTVSDITLFGVPAQLIGPGQWMTTLLQYGYYLGASYLLFRNLRSKQRDLKITAQLLLACTLPPWLIDLFSLTGWQPGMLVFAPPYIYLLCSILFLVALFRYRLLNIIPIAFEALIAEINDAIIVLDANQTVLHLNHAAEQILGISLRQATGKTAEVALANYPDLLPYVNQGDFGDNNEVSLSTAQGNLIFEIMAPPIRGQWKNIIGRALILHNITKRVNAEATSRHSQALLLRSEETYRQLVENINEVIFTVDANLIISYISPVIERYTGYRASDLTGQHIDILTHPDDLERLHKSMIRALESDDYTEDFRLIDNKGREHFTHVQYHRLMQNGLVTGLQGMLTDVTEYKRAQEVLERQTMQLQMVNHIGEQIAAVMELDQILDNATRLIRTNFGYYHVALFLPDIEENCLVLRSAAGPFTTIFPSNHRLMLGQGIIGWVAENHSLLLANDVHSEPRYINFYPDKIVTQSELAVPVLLYDELVGVLDIQSPLINGFTENDIRVLKTVADQIAVAIGNARLYDQLRLQLKESEQKENILRIQRDMLIELSSFTYIDEMLDHAVRALARNLNVPLAEIILLDPTGEQMLVAASLGTEEKYRQPMPIGTGVTGWVASTGQPALIPDVSQIDYYVAVSSATHSEICAPITTGERVIGVINLESPQLSAFTQDDLRLLMILSNNLSVLIERARLFSEVEGARHELETRALALEAANKRLLELDRLKSQFLANMSHELRTPLNSIIGFSEVIYDEVIGPISSDQREYIQYIYESGKHLLELINDLLDFSKIEAGRMQLEWTTFSVDGLLTEVNSIISPQIEKRNQQLVFKIEEGLPQITADRLRMRQVFFNLISNANKFSPPGEKIEVSCQREFNGTIRFAVRDHGIGIRHDDQKVIFEEFRQVDGSLTREVAGTGLGLAISKRIVELHHGSIWVESEYGQGATFFISLPINDVPDMI